ncbi:hypothetical protein CORMATOL_01397 [Corynebacterium matruchotii ATCC 33806]|uniref:Uncharacterized protein n=1 Tax=Corynebacterium matruchotii ATCC 33806 TaxID=566549 RepID=C0E334_9CORY|nr:hypothetical protein CORMATOL_01397 [Corynebacterium matruchotii ATCC 33806]
MTAIELCTFRCDYLKVFVENPRGGFALPRGLLFKSVGALPHQLMMGLRGAHQRIR